jgi:hypothetical protein
MSYTIDSAHWGDTARDTAVIVTKEAGHLFLSARDHPEEWAALIAWNVDNPVADVPAAPDLVPAVISDRQFYQQLAVMGLITQSEALAAVKVGTVPATLQGFIDALPSDQQFAAEMHVAGAVAFRRDHPLTAALAAVMGWTSDQVDQLWIAAAQL